MRKLSEYCSKLKSFNKKYIGKKREIRVEVSVLTDRGIGIVTWRKGDEIEVAVKPDRVDEVMPCYRYNYAIYDVEISIDAVPKNDRLYNGAWYWIMSQAIVENQDYEAIKHRAVFDDQESNIPGKRTDREISIGTWGSATYRRYTGVNKFGQPFDFELCLRPALAIPYGDRIMYSLGFSDGHITDMNGHGWIYRRKMRDNDINYGLAKYASPQEVVV
ncbi:hypothetical protein [Bacillus velezensis]|uniref:hypothetical protein n=1 Tax=Bacillus velezensis TaxID=492670 RepID=UPI0009F64FA3|nr:hypothetical protein [Bacillus velezensis]OQV53376.1 hypothetical protein B5Z20_03415 [Bacillus velezensis]OQV55399.1 hypothetical protein B5Z22_08280 [Bacillus velezensis]OQV60890.1 hypothetical protein B5Z24_08285 [Bacillus velezensis]OQV61957.1 hypothetical protein B5Z23_08270 [Bacillus velezensis]